jgi:hypothetical protein
MTHITAKTVRTGCVGLVTAILALAISGDVVAKASKPRLHQRSLMAQDRMEDSAKPATPGPLRYYGGPKSPMWRAAD